LTVSVLRSIIQPSRKETEMKKDGIVTFKVEKDLWEAMRDIPNRSAFIRSAVVAALAGACPVCNGTGILSPEQRRHWEDFVKDHSLSRCETCRGVVICCRTEGE